MQTTPGINPPIGFSISHDNALIAMAFAPGDHEPPAFQVGVDIMKVNLPQREPFPKFVEIFSEQASCDGKSRMISTTHTSWY